ncbi:hypothetical protein Cgig2_003365 [Carnegiea gigantea]|uniref:BED-type domain-containing protein n=1 Tax=Carnegiea gigantea TaxID=171969 RepID=A0A9Q1JWG3_9CARY|nr:hypothetical protein Cgig2_003365 [Carnegiea gigantea]
MLASKEKKSRHNSRSNEDIGWRFGIAIDRSRKQVQCKFCSKVIRGGITRLKQHLAHKTGDVAPCPDVSADVKRDMMKLLQDYKEKKRQKTRITRDLEDEITRSFNRDDYVDEKEEKDAQLAHARYQSLERHRRPPRVPQMRRSATVRETSSRGSREMAYEQMSTPAARLRAVEVELEKDRTRTKQSKDISLIPNTCIDKVKIGKTERSGGGGDGGNGGANEMGASYSSRQSTDYFTDRGRGVPVEDDRRSRRSPDEQPREPTHTYRRVRKGKEPVQPHGYPTDAIGPGLFAHSSGYDTYGDVFNNYGYSSTNTNCPPPPYLSHEPQSAGSDSSRRHRDNPPIINQGTIN